jgi:hypothetical protein
MVVPIKMETTSVDTTLPAIENDVRELAQLLWIIASLFKSCSIRHVVIDCCWSQRGQKDKYRKTLPCEPGRSLQVKQR